MKKYWLLIATLVTVNTSLGILNGGGTGEIWKNCEINRAPMTNNEKICCLMCCPLIGWIIYIPDIEKSILNSYAQYNLKQYLPAPEFFNEHLIKAIDDKNSHAIQMALQAGADINCVPKHNVNILGWQAYEKNHQEVLFLLQNNARIKGYSVNKYLENNVTDIATAKTIDNRTFTTYLLFFHQLYFAAMQDPTWHTKLIALHDHLRTKNPYLLKLLSAQSEFEKYPTDLIEKLRITNLFPLITMEETMQKKIYAHQNNGLKKIYDCSFCFQQIS